MNRCTTPITKGEPVPVWTLGDIVTPVHYTALYKENGDFKGFKCKECFAIGGNSGNLDCHYRICSRSVYSPHNR